jgi:hypothetical protein
MQIDGENGTPQGDMTLGCSYMSQKIIGGGC